MDWIWDQASVSLRNLKWFSITFFRPPRTSKTTVHGLSSPEKLTASTSLCLPISSKGNLSKLKEVYDEIVSMHPTTKIKIFTMNFSGENTGGRGEDNLLPAPNLITTRNDRVLGFPVGFGFFHEAEEEVWMNAMKVNMIGRSLVTRVVIEGMVERKRCVTDNIGSGVVIVVPSHPFYVIYDANKA
uniref:Uncharacterized protein n=1 Tax=Lactuca sativa TaxID=4236 RepID=A0A9R1W6X6_LACSA|nr:hypothetical protein LSAT_V11C300140110 [Lactuca sativa]